MGYIATAVQAPWNMSLRGGKKPAAEDIEGRFRLYETHMETSGKHVMLLAVITKKGNLDSIAFRSGQSIRIKNPNQKNDSKVFAVNAAFITPARYYRPGDKVTSCLLAVGADQWASFNRFPWQ